MKAQIISLAAIFAFSVTMSVQAGDNHSHGHKHEGDKKHAHGKKHHKHAHGIIKLPHPMKVIMKNKDVLKITAEQEKLLETEIMAVYPGKIHPLMDEIRKLEHKLKKAVLKEHKTAWDLTHEIQDLADKKLELSKNQIAALNKISKILSKEQWTEVRKMMRHKKKRMMHNKKHGEHKHSHSEEKHSH